MGVKSREEAQAAADKLVETLGEGWTTRIWENLGWCFSAVSACGRWKVHQAPLHWEKTWYTAFLGHKDLPGGKWARHGDTPQEAIENTRKTALEEILGKAALLDLRLVDEYGNEVSHETG